MVVLIFHPMTFVFLCNCSTNVPIRYSSYSINQKSSSSSVSTSPKLIASFTLAEGDKPKSVPNDLICAAASFFLIKKGFGLPSIHSPFDFICLLQDRYSEYASQYNAK